jgi:hypothetical protein
MIYSMIYSESRHSVADRSCVQLQQQLDVVRLRLARLLLRAVSLA